MASPRTVLFAQRYADGGSVVSLLDLVRSLDPARYRPVVAFREPSTWVGEFARAGIDVVVFPSTALISGADLPADGAAPSAATPTAAPTGPVVRVPKGAVRREVRRFVRRDLPSIRWLLRVIRAHGVDLVHANNDVLSNRDALVAAALRRRPIVQHVRNLYDQERDIGLRIDRVLSRLPDRFLFISQASADHHADLLPRSARRATVLDNPFDVGAYRADRSPELAAELGLAPGAPVVLSLGRLARWKGQDVFVRAMAEVIAERPEVRALVVGAPLGRRGNAFAAEVRELAVELGVADAVVFAGARRDVPAVLALADVFVHSATSPEPFGRVVVEAMAAGRPVVASDDGGVREIVDPGVTGRLVPPGRPHELAAVIGELLDRPDEARALGERARAAVGERFSLQAHAAAVQAVYDSLS